jgi:hypothetical protein
MGSGISEWTLDRITRPMKSLDQWVGGGQGGGRNARHVEAHHLAYILMAIAVWDLKEADAEATAKLGAMVPAPKETPFFGSPGTLIAEGEQFLQGDTLAEALSLYIAGAVTLDGRQRAASEHLNFTVYSFGGSLVYAALAALKHAPDGDVEQISCLYLPREPDLAVSGSDAPYAPQRQISFSSGLIQLLADIYADTLKHRAEILALTLLKTKRRPSARKASARA